jgi:hypothetical protein
MRFLGMVLGFAMLVQFSPAVADGPGASASPSPASAPSGPSFHDKSINFTAPDGWTKIDVPVPDNTDNPTVVAIFTKRQGKPDQRTIQIVVQDYDQGLDPWEVATETDLRNKVDSTFIDKKTKTTLSNGMPAWWIKVSQGASLGQFFRRYEYVVYDLQRGITVSFIGRQGDFDEKEAKDALAGLTVVVYPRDR